MWTAIENRRQIKRLHRPCDIKPCDMRRAPSKERRKSAIRADRIGQADRARLDGLADQLAARAPRKIRGDRARTRDQHPSATRIERGRGISAP
ncbi:hypothetical protein M9978_08285 [Sphingomonas sp. MG17]|uniref:Uncharacterized protein n=1 Tax=Sphingomonas tagetis TaxID=2949092 RepID=A0A9X2HR94_9SPHN|nr:hypothetical protein [Sphingomonas tagetis]MCP3730425.1 hypothetical protein [Sphingomonas tagetis]